MMSYVVPLLIFLTVLSPLFIPIGVTVVHAIASRRPHLSRLRAVPAAQRRRVELAAEFD
jgi:hypothetical protein